MLKGINITKSIYFLFLIISSFTYQVIGESPPSIITINPSIIFNNVDNIITISGDNFELSSIVKVNGMPYPSSQPWTNVVDSQTIILLVPGGTPVGTYNLTVFNPSNGLESNWMMVTVQLQSPTPLLSSLNLHFHLSKPQLILSWREMPTGLPPPAPQTEWGFPDSPAVILPSDNPANPQFLFSNHHRIINPLTNPVFDKNSILPNNWPHDILLPDGSLDRCGDWFMNALYQDTSQPGLIRAWLHQEGDLSSTQLCRYDGGQWGTGQILQSISYFYSPDGGVTWVQPLNNQILSSHYAPQPGTGGNGVASPTLLKDGDFLYLFYKENGQPVTSSSTQLYNFQGIAVARATVDSGGLPGNWFKYYNGNFVEPGLNGQYTIILPGWDFPMSAGKNTFFAGLGVPYYLLSGFNDKPAILRFSNSITNWNSASFIQLLTDNVPGAWIGTVPVKGYPSLHIYQTSSNEVIGNFYYMYKPLGQPLENRALIKRTLSIHTAFSFLPATQPLVKYYSQSRSDTQVTTELPIPLNLPWDYSEQNILGYTFIQAPAGFSVNELTGCFSSTAQDYYAVVGRNCGNDLLVGYLGFIYSNYQPNSAPIYNCNDIQNSDRFLSINQNCDSLGTGILFGYILQDPDATSPHSGLPDSPSNLSALIIGNQVTLLWNDNANNEIGFKIERSIYSNATGFAEITSTLPQNTISFNDTGLVPGILYYYRVRAFNSFGNSNYSNEIQAALYYIQVPNPPSNLRASAISPTQLRIEWDDNSNNELGFKIERSIDSSIFYQVGIANIDTTEFIDVDLKPETNYWYKVSAFNEKGNSNYSNIYYATTFEKPTNQSWPLLNSLSKYIVINDDDMVVTLFGQNLMHGAIVNVHDYPTTWKTNYVNSNQINIIIPKGTTPGLYYISVKNPNGLESQRLILTVKVRDIAKIRKDILRRETKSLTIFLIIGVITILVIILYIILRKK